MNSEDVIELFEQRDSYTRDNMPRLVSGEMEVSEFLDTIRTIENEIRSAAIYVTRSFEEFQAYIMGCYPQIMGLITGFRHLIEVSARFGVTEFEFGILEAVENVDQEMPIVVMTPGQPAHNVGKTRVKYNARHVAPYLTDNLAEVAGDWPPGKIITYIRTTLEVEREESELFLNGVTGSQRPPKPPEA